MKGQIDAIVVHLLLCLVQKSLLVFLRGVFLNLFLTCQITAGVCFYYEVFLKFAYSERP